MKKRGIIFFLLLLMMTVTACGTSPKKELNQAISRIEKVENYKLVFTTDEKITVLNKQNRRKIVLTKEVDNENQVEKIMTKVTKGKDTYQEESYYQMKNQFTYYKDTITNAWKKEKIEDETDLLDFSVIMNDKVKVEEVKSDKRLQKKYQVVLSKEDTKRLFYRKLNDEYISMRVVDGATIYFYINSSDYLSHIEIDLTKQIDMRDPDSHCDKLKFQFEFSDYNNLGEVEIPLYVTGSAVNGKGK